MHHLSFWTCHFPRHRKHLAQSRKFCAAVKQLWPDAVPPTTSDSSYLYHQLGQLYNSLSSLCNYSCSSHRKLTYITFYTYLLHKKTVVEARTVNIFQNAKTSRHRSQTAGKNSLAVKLFSCHLRGSRVVKLETCSRGHGCPTLSRNPLTTSVVHTLYYKSLLVYTQWW